jgi:DNA polymerase (family 10)
MSDVVSSYMKIHKNMTNREIAHLLRSIAAAYEIKDEKKNLFRIRAYGRAADAVEHLSIEAKDLWDDGELEKVGGIGPSIAKHLDEIFRTGKSKHFSLVTKGIKPATFKLMDLEGVGPKTAYKLTDELNINTEKEALNKLEKYSREGKVAEIEGMGKTSQDEILRSIKDLKNKKDRMLLSYAENIANEILQWMKKNKDVEEADALGSLRRKAATVGDIDISVSSDKAKKVLDHFEKYPKKVRTIERGDAAASILLANDIRVDLKLMKPESYGSLLQHFTGSKHHNIALREYAMKKKLSLSEYGIKVSSKNKKTKRLKKFSDEKSFYNYLKMSYIPPELREANGEVEAAQRSFKGKSNGIPDLIEISDIKADLQIHSDFDIETSHDLGESSMNDIVTKADELGYEYIAFTEHNPSQTGHKDEDVIELLKRKKDAIEKINENLNKKNKSQKSQKKQRTLKRVFNSLEIDIMPDGKLPVSENGLELLDFALVSIHSSFRQSRAKMTARILHAFENPKIKIFAHPTGRMLGKREGVEMDWEKIFSACQKKGIWLEINADPMRLDLPDVKVKDAIEAGIKMTLGTDSHHKDSLDNMRWGVYVARRGWATAFDIANTRSLKQFEKMLE